MPGTFLWELRSKSLITVTRPRGCATSGDPRCDSDRIHWARRAQELEKTVEELKLKLANSEAGEMGGFQWFPMVSIVRAHLKMDDLEVAVF